MAGHHVYGIPPEQVIGSSIKTKFEMRDGKPVLIRLPELNFMDDKEGKPSGISQYIGRRPIAAFGNPAGDLQICNGPLAARDQALVLSCTTLMAGASGNTTAMRRRVLPVWTGH